MRHEKYRRHHQVCRKNVAQMEPDRVDGSTDMRSKPSKGLTEVRRIG
jgi:hypothetical protein